MKSFLKRKEPLLDLPLEDASCWYRWGVAYAEMGRSREAIKCFDKTLELDPKHKAAWFRRCSLQFD